MTILYLPIDGTETTCQKTAIPKGCQGNMRDPYPEGVCRYYCQAPIGTHQSCLAFIEHVDDNKKPEIIEIGLTKRLPQCIEQEKLIDGKRVIAIEVNASAEFCETVPIDFKAEKEKRGNRKIDDIMADPNVYVCRDGSGHSVFYNPAVVCKAYIDYPNGSKWCGLMRQTRNTVFLRRGDNGFTPRTQACLNCSKK